MSYTRARMNKIMDMVEEHAENERKVIDEAFPTPVLGEATVDDDTFMQFVNQMIAQHPPVEIRFEDGSTTTMSPWMAALSMVEGGDEILDRIEKIADGLRPN